MEKDKESEQTTNLRILMTRLNKIDENLSMLTKKTKRLDDCLNRLLIELKKHRATRQEEI
jgi:hypothetical protein